MRQAGGAGRQEWGWGLGLAAIDDSQRGRLAWLLSSGGDEQDAQGGIQAGLTIAGLGLQFVALWREQHLTHGVDEIGDFVVAEFFGHRCKMGVHMPYVETEIWLALKNAVTAAAAALPVAWPDGVFTPPTAGAELLPYLSVGKVSAPPRRVLIGKGQHDRSGSLTLVHVAQIGNPAEWYLQKAAGIADHFAEDTRLRFGSVSLRVSSRPHVADSYRDAGYLRTPIIIPWQAFA